VPAERHIEWVLKNPPQEATTLPGHPRLLGDLLRQRGHITPAAAEAFLDPRLDALSDPFRLPGMAAAVERLLAAVDAREKVVIYGDYDVDGVTSITLLHTVLRAYGLEPHPFLPHRVDEGYGLSTEGLERCLEECAPTLLVAVDCGTTSVTEISSLAARGIDVIVCDHHERGPDGLPPCVALVNPQVGDDFHYLCTVGIIFKLAHALLKKRPNPTFKLRDHLDLVAVGTVADIVPLVGENRALVRRGLHELAHTRNHGLAALRDITRITPPFGAGDIGFRIGPRLNAAGRLDTAREALDLLMADTPARAHRLAEGLERQNAERQRVELRIREAAEAQFEEEFGTAPEPPAGIVLGSVDWHVGVVGIVASRISKRHHRPTFVIAFDENGLGKGSGRSVEGISLVEAINDCRDLLVKGGGHAMAAGITIEQAAFADFRTRFAASVAAAAPSGALIPKLHLDTAVRLDELTLPLLAAYERLEPFGSGNPQPVFMARGVQPAEEPKIMKEKHYRFRLQQGRARQDAVYFNGVEHPLPLAPWDIAFTISRNEFRGRISLQLLIQGIRAAEK
jgi:single-stranded-DNA-specific exonuclease